MVHREPSPPQGVRAKLSQALARAKVAALRLEIGKGKAKVLTRIRRGERTFFVMVAILIGVLGGFGAILFRGLILATHETFSFPVGSSLDSLRAMPWWHKLLLPTLGGLLVGIIVTRFASEVKGSGIPEVMEAVARRGGLIRARVIFAKIAAAAVTLGSGGSAGREGPIVHIGSAIGSAVGQILQVPAQQLRAFVACGAAAGIAATFNAPIAGALFAIEVVLVDLGVANLSGIVISSVVATVISRHYLGDYPALRVPQYELIDSRELVLYAGLGLLSGLVAVAFIRTLFGVASTFERLDKVPEWVKPGIGGLGVGLIAIFLPQVLGVGYVTIDDALWGRAPMALLSLLVVAKLVATSLCLGSGGSGGVFAPSLFLGAALGAAYGNLVHGTFPTWTAEEGAYALVGMGAVVSATTHAPITSILIIFELTNDYRIMPPLMLASVVAVLLSGRLHRASIYTEKLERRGLKLREGRDINLLRAIPVEEVMDREPAVVSSDAAFSEILPQLLSTQHRKLIVVDRDERYVGAVTLDDIKAILPDSSVLTPFAVAADAVNETVPFVLPSDNLDLVMHLFGRSHREELPVCDDASSRRVVGVVTREAVIDSYNKRVFQLDLAGGFSSLVAAVQAGRTVEVLGGLHLGEVDVPSALVGKTLADTALRRAHGLEVVLIHLASEGEGDMHGRAGKFPAPGVELQPGDRLLVLGSPEDIERFRQ